MINVAQAQRVIKEYFLAISVAKFQVHLHHRTLDQTGIGDLWLYGTNNGSRKDPMASANVLTFDYDSKKIVLKRC